MGYKLLLADDSITIQKVVGIIFANEDYELTVVDNGNDALEKAREIVPDVILVDALMPGKSGYDVCREVREDTEVSGIPLLLLVGAFEPFDEEKARESGADDHISKPFESQHLIEKVKGLIELGRERAELGAASAMTSYTAEPAGAISLGVAPLPDFEADALPPADDLADRDVGEERDGVLYLDSLEILEASPDDDLWGDFEVEDMPEGEEVRLGEVVEQDVVPTEVIDTVEEVEPFVFREEESAVSESGNIISLGDDPESGPGAGIESERGFAFREEPEPVDYPAFSAAGFSGEPLDVISPATVGETWEPKPEIPGFAEMPPVGFQGTDGDMLSETSFPDFGQELRLTPEEEYMPTPESLYEKADVCEAGVPEPASADTISLSEEQLAAVISRVSREMIERIAWEVVPDLAETIIREEIRKIKEGY